jgi:hypothetical protein
MIIGVGGLLMLIGAIWMICLAVTGEPTTGGKVIWAIAIFLTGPLAGTIYFLVKKIGMVPLILMWIAILFYGFSIFTSVPSVAP